MAKDAVKGHSVPDILKETRWSSGAPCIFSKELRCKAEPVEQFLHRDPVFGAIPFPH
jgi:hypothetical protein